MCTRKFVQGFNLNIICLEELLSRVNSICPLQCKCHYLVKKPPIPLYLPSRCRRQTPLLFPSAWLPATAVLAALTPTIAPIELKS